MFMHKSANLSATALAIAAAGWGLMAGPAWADESADSLAAALAGGITQLDLRLRYERVEQDNALDDADALTLRTRLGYSTRAWNALTAFVEMENVSALVDDYAPENAGYSVVADPEGAEVNQYGLRYNGVPGLAATLGRSKLILDNARWVGNVGWRQNEQTFDGVFLKYTGIPALTGQYAYLSNVNTITGTNVDLDGHLLNLGWALLPQLTLTGYAYLLDYMAAAATDFDTYGLRAAGSAPITDAVKLIYAAEYARQKAETAAADFDADYLLAELGVGFKPVTVTVGYEVLGSDGGAFGLQTPLATKHAFQGWADVFLTTPPTGVRDLYVSASGSAGPVKLAAAYHQFSADETTPTLDDYGSEIDLSAGMKLVGKLGGLVKYARYSADDFGVDTDKLWVQLDYAF
ncbi:hypothetical protein AAG565_07000 [Fontimonas sp. SYSU GA230001]|uniref:hypothetical protein n=1 Tax=Fontimonas sp. SYSU GA230001 TaxID=3142450 RepID=UPI0032B38B08